MDATLVTLSIIAIVKLCQEVNQKDWKGAAKIIGAAFFGVGAGFFGIDGMNIFTGLSAGLSAAGIVTSIGFGGNKIASGINSTITSLLSNETVKNYINDLIEKIKA